MAYFTASCDTPETNKKWAKKLELDYPVLSDEGGKVAKEYGILSPRGFSSRVTFIVSPDGKLAHIDKSVKAAQHASDVLKKLEELKVEKKKTG